ncbi:MAG TPA: hypothetical protein DDW27_01175 [Bacteroidales bacterium]|nr:hypothetical protein [Bacteroidales bacterium]
MESRLLIKLILIFTITGAVLLLTNCKKDNEPLPLSEIPSIQTSEPAEGSIGTEITIKGSNFKSGASVKVGDKVSPTVEVSSGSLIYAIVPSGIPANILLTVEVKNPSGGEASLVNAFKAINPVLSYVNSATRPSGNIGSTVILEGNAFGDIQGGGKVLFSDGTATGTITAIIAGPDDWTNTFIVTTVPGGTMDGPVIVQTGIGKSNSIPFKVTANATFSPSTINWTSTTALPLAVSGHNALNVSVDDASLVTNQYVYVSGGRKSDGNPTDQMIFGRITSDGRIDAWTSTTLLPSDLSFHTTVAATPFNSKAGGSGYIYVIGGINPGGTILTTVSTGTLNNDGTIKTPWAGTKALPKPLYSAGAVIFRGSLYIVGGSTTGNVTVKNVYRALINPDGQLGDWETMPDLPGERSHHGLVTFGGYLYCAGGETVAGDPDAGTAGTNSDQLFYSKINLRTGELGSWTVNPNSLQKSRSKHSTLVLGGNIFITSGLYSGLSGGVQGSSENIYAVINADGTVGSFNGATGSNTLFTAGGSNLFNQAGISYIDADGVAHVMIIGGAKVGSPATKLDKILFY